MKGKLKRQGVHVGRRSDWKKSIVTIATESKTLQYATKGGKMQTVNKTYKTAIEEFGI